MAPTPNSSSSPKRSIVWSTIRTAFKLIWSLFVILTPLLGVWVGSSLTSYLGGPVWLVCLAGVLLFPLLPLLWEWRGHRAWLRRMEARRKAKKPTRDKLLTFWDRFVLRTLVLNLLVLIGLLAATPQTAFTALSTRGDWMLDTQTSPLRTWLQNEEREGTWVQSTREGLFRVAGGLEWLYNATRDNPYDTDTPSDRIPGDDSVPAPAPNEFAGDVLPESDGSDPPAPSKDPKPDQAPEAKAKDPKAWPFEPTLHPAVASIPKGEETSPESVARYLASRERDPLQLTKALHDYVADRIAYDAPALARGEYPPQDPNTVFKTRKAVCAGYSKLFAAMGKAAGLEVVYVVGDSRDMDGEVDGSGHAWNAVRLSGEWYLIDVTWDSGYVEGSTFHKRYKTDYFLTPPQVFGITHHPEKEAWQLLKEPISRGAFMRLPMMDSAFFRNGLVLVTPDRSVVSATDQMTIKITNPHERFIMGHVRTMAGEDVQKCEVVQGRDTTLTCSFPAGGRYRVEMFDNEDRYGRYGYIGQIHVNARR